MWNSITINDMKEFLKNLPYFFGICGWLLGTIGGVGYALYAKAWIIAAGVAFLGVLSFPAVRDFVNKLTAPKGKANE